MGTQPTEPNATDRDDAGVAAVRHLFRNQIQAMTSLVGLFGRRLPPGDGRDAFTDLRARFEAATFGPADDAKPDARGRYEIDFAEVARRVASHLDPEFRHRLSVAGEPAAASPRRASAIAQILAETVIDLIRNGCDDGRTRAAEISISTDGDGRILIRALQTGPDGAAPRRDPQDLGLAIADSLVRSLGGTVSRAGDGPLSTDISIPAEVESR